MTMFKSSVAILSAIIMLAGGLKIYHTTVSYFEPQAHAASEREKILDKVAAVENTFQDFSLRLQRDQVLKEMWALEDRNNTKEPLNMEEKDRVRYRTLQEQLEYLDQKLDGQGR
jgi:predicted  nucleic acid-binding Zn-ribbon protein